MTTTQSADILKKNTLLNTGVMEIYDPAIGDYVQCAGFEDLSVETTTEAKDPQPVAGGIGGERVVRQDATVRCQLQAIRSPWILQKLFGLQPSAITTGDDISITDATITVDMLAGDGIYRAMIPDITWGADVLVPVTNVRTQAGDLLTAGDDYTVTMVNGYTAIQPTAGSGIARGDVLMVDYTYAPLQHITLQGGLPLALTPSRFRFCGGLHSGVPVAQQDSVVQIVLDEADVTSALRLDFLSTDKEADPFLFPLEIENRKNSPWEFQFIQRSV